MTFIVAASTDDIAVHVADTRLTKTDGSFYADDLVKTTVLHCKDAALLLSYTGLASIDGKRTDQWIVAQLHKFNAPAKVFVEIVNHLTDAFSDARRRNAPLAQFGVTLAINGLGVSPTGVHQQAVAVISNTEEPRPKRNAFVYVNPRGRNFRCFFLPPPNSYYMAVHGSVSETLNISGHRKSIIRCLQTIKAQGEVKPLLDSLAAMLRDQRTDPKLSNVIGDECTAVAIGRDYGSIAYFYASSGSAVSRYPNIVRPGYTVEDFTISPM